MAVEGTQTTVGAEPGTRVAGFQIERFLARRHGGGAVYEAREPDGGRRLALELHARERIADAGFRERFLRDAELLEGVRHRSLPEVVARGEALEGLYVATVLGEGMRLDALLRHEALPPMRVVRTLGEVADALDAASGASLLHRDVRPANVLIHERGVERVLLCDFALGEPGLGREGAAYSAPEVIRGAAATPASDIYSLACTLFECLTGRPPFEGNVSQAHLSEEPPRASELRPDLPDSVDAVLTRGLAKSPADRPASAAELIAEASRALMATPLQPQTPVDTSSFAPVVAPPPPPAPPVPPTVPAEAPALQPEAPPTEKRAPASEPVAAAAPAPAAEIAIEPEPREAGSRLGRRGLIVATALVAAAGVAGFLVGRPGDEQGDVAPANAGAGARLTPPADWRPQASAPKLGRLKLASPVAFAAAGGDPGLVTGVTRDSRASLQPGVAARAVSARPPRPSPVRLGGFEAYRYRDLRTRRPDRRITLFVAPTSAGALVAACHAAPGAGAAPALADCERAAASLQGGETRPYSLGDGAGYLAGLDRTIGRLNRGRLRLRRRLNRAGTPAGQRRAATALARAHSGARAALARPGVPPAAQKAHERLAAGLSRITRAYRRLARATRRSGRGRFRAARRAVARSERELRAELRQLRP